jgi:rubredoxin
MKCSLCGGSNFKEWDGEYICKDCGTRNKKETTTTTTTAKPLSTAGAVGVCEICGGKDFKEYMGKKICKNCGSPLKATSTTTTTTTSKPTTTTSTTTSKPLSTASTSAGVCKICGGKDFKEYLGRKICKNCGSPLEITSTTTTTTTSTPTSSTTTSKPRTTKSTTKSTTTSKPLSTPIPHVTETVSTPPVSYKYDFSIVFKPSVKLFGFESFTKDKKIADEILNYLLSKKYKVSERPPTIFPLNISTKELILSTNCK